MLNWDLITFVTMQFGNFLHVACSHVHNPEWQPLTYPSAQWSSLLVHTPSELQGTPTANPTKIHRRPCVDWFLFKVRTDGSISNLEVLIRNALCNLVF